MITKSFKYQINKRDAIANANKSGVSAEQFFKGVSVCLSFLTVFIISFLVPNSSVVLGIIVSFAIWVLFYDFILSNRLKKGLVKFFKAGKVKTGRTYVIVMHSFVGLMVGIAFITFLIAAKYVNWHDFFHFSDFTNSDFNRIVFLILTIFSFRILFVLIGAIVVSKKLTVTYNQIDFISVLLTLTLVCLFTLLPENQLTYLRLIIYSAPLILFFFSISLLLRIRIRKIQPAPSNYIN